MKTATLFFLLFFFNFQLVAQNQNISQGNVFDGEPFIAINPHNSQHIIVAWMGYEYLQKVKIKIKVSEDGGITWSNETTLPHLQLNYTSADPSIVFDNNGNIYLCYIDYKLTKDEGKVVVRKSVDGGYTWSSPTTVVSIQDDAPRIPIDRPWISIDTSGTSTNGNLYVTTMNAHGAIPDFHPYFFVSTDDNSTWSSLRNLDGGNWLSGNLIPQPMPTNTVSSNGIFYAIYPSYKISQNVLPQYILATSIDGGNSFNYSSAFASANSGVNDSLAKSSYVLISDPSNSNHLAFVFLQKNGNDPADVFMIESFDNGFTWSSPLLVNDDNSNRLQDMVWASFDVDGDLVISWRDRRNGDNNTYETDYEFYATAKSHGSNQFDSNFLLSNSVIAYDTILAENGNDFMCNRVLNDTIYSVWSDTRNGSLNVWYQKTSTAGELLIIKSITSSKVSIYPNPASHIIQIKHSLINAKLEVFSLEGKLIIMNPNYSSNENILIENLPKGRYVYTLNNGEYSGSFIKK